MYMCMVPGFQETLMITLGRLYKTQLFMFKVCRIVFTIVTQQVD